MIIIVAYILEAECTIAVHGTLINVLTRFLIVIFQIYLLIISGKNVKKNLETIDSNMEYLRDIAATTESSSSNTSSVVIGSSIGGDGNSLLDVSYESGIVSTGIQRSGF